MIFRHILFFYIRLCRMLLLLKLKAAKRTVPVTSINRMDTIDPKAQSGYNNNTTVNQNNGGNEDVKTSDQGRFGENGNRSNQSDQGSRTSIKEHRPESQGSFIRRTRNETRNGRQKLVEFSGDKTFAYFPAEPDGSQAYRATEYLNGIGVKAIYCDGIMESNDGTTTSTHPEAVTAPDGTIYISNQSGLVAKAIVSHEAVHHNQRKNSKAFREYSAVIKENLLIENKSFKEFAELVFKKHFDVDYQSNSENKKLLRAFGNELLAYVHEYITVDKRFAFDKFSSMFTDWDAVVEASRRFNEAIGLDFSEETSPTSQVENGESVFNISARGDRKDAEETAPTSGRVLDMPAISVKAQNFVKGIGKALGRNIEFVNMEKFLKEHDINTEKLKIYPEGAIDGEGNIFLWYNAEKPVQFLFKHELTHFGERSEHYGRFVKFVRNSKTYLEWLRQKTGLKDAGREKMEAELMEKHRSAQGNLKNLSFDEARAEIIADFVGENCFGESLEGLNTLIEEANLKQYPRAIQFLVDFFAYLKKRLAGKQITLELSRIEDSFRRLISDANNTKTPDNKDGGLKYSYAGDNSLTANRSALTDAVVLKAKGIDDTIILERTGWFKGGDGKWRYNIPDNELKINVRFLFSEHMTLGDLVKHDKLFAAYPELKNIKLSFKQRAKGKNGSYNHSSYEIVLNTLLRNDIDKLKDTLVHEMQHAIQHIEGFAEGGDIILGLRIAFNYAYEQVKYTEEYKAISTPDKKEEYIFDAAAKLFSVKRIEDAAKIAYKNLYGEVEAREVSNNREFEENELRKLKPDITGNIADKNSVVEDYIANLTEIGYTEEEIISRFGGIINDQSGSIQDISRRYEDVERMDRLLPSDKSVRMSSLFEDSAYSEGETGNMGRGVHSGVFDRRGARNDIKFSVPTATESDTETDTDTENTDFTAEFKELMQSFQKGEISQDEYMRMCRGCVAGTVLENRPRDKL